MRRLALLLLVPLAYAPAASAYQRPNLGCFGAGATMYCNPWVRVEGVTWRDTPVCVSVCADVPTPQVRWDAQVCVDYTDRTGGARSTCDESR